MVSNQFEFKDLHFQIISRMLHEELSGGGIGDMDRFRISIGAAGRKALDELNSRSLLSRGHGPGDKLKLTAVLLLARNQGEIGAEARSLIADCDRLLGGG